MVDNRMETSVSDIYAAADARQGSSLAIAAAAGDETTTTTPVKGIIYIT